MAYPGGFGKNNYPGSYAPPPQHPQQYQGGYQQPPPGQYQGGYAPQPPYHPPPYGGQQMPQWQAPPAAYQQQNAAMISPCNGRKKALLIGINYTGTSSALNGCINDVINVKNYLVNERGWPSDPGSIVVMTENDPNPLMRPTKQNMIQAMAWLASCNNYGDSLFFHFSGHGGQRQDISGDESDGMDETILPLDFQRAGHLTDDDLNRMLVRPLPRGVRLTAIFDCCHSGSSLDLPFTYHPDGRLKSSSASSKLGSAVKDVMRGDIFGAINSGLSILAGSQQSQQQKELEKGNAYADVIMFSGCKDKQTSADAYLAGQSTGAMSFALLRALRAQPQISYGQLLWNVRTILQERFHQIPQLSSDKMPKDKLGKPLKASPKSKILTRKEPRSGPRIPPPKKKHFKPWREEEDEILRKEILQQNRQKPAWKKISKLLYKRTPGECQARWEWLDPLVDRSEWTPEKDKMLLELMENTEFDSWTKRAQALGEGEKRRATADCVERYHKIKANSS